MVKQWRAAVVAPAAADWRAGEQGGVQVVFPGAGKRALADQLRQAGTAVVTVGGGASGGHQRLARVHVLQAAQSHRHHAAHGQQGLDEAKAGGLVIGHGNGGEGFARLGGNFDLLGLQHQVTDGQNQAVAPNHHTRAAAVQAQRAR